MTGADSDAEKDVLRNAQLRWPSVRFRVHHSAVQGERAVGELVAGIRALDADPEVDVIIVARGGGDFQNLLPFSDEAVVRAARVIRPATSFGGVESTWERRARWSSEKAGHSLIRLSVGLEDPADLTADIEQALARVAPAP